MDGCSIVMSLLFSSFSLWFMDFIIVVFSYRIWAFCLDQPLVYNLLSFGLFYCKIKNPGTIGYILVTAFSLALSSFHFILLQDLLIIFLFILSFYNLLCKSFKKPFRHYYLLNSFSSLSLLASHSNFILIFSFLNR